MKELVLYKVVTAGATAVLFALIDLILFWIRGYVSEINIWFQIGWVISAAVWARPRGY